jgi:hypothetical protein
VTVHGTVFAGRELHLDAVREGETVLLVADPPCQDVPEVWVHLGTGEPIGHLPADVSHWLWPWLAQGGRADAVAVRVGGRDEPSWRRVVVEVACRAGGGGAGEG